MILKKKPIIDQWITRMIPCACAEKGLHSVKMGFAANVLRHISTDCDVHWDAACTATELGNRTCVTFVKTLKEHLYGDERNTYGSPIEDVQRAVGAASRMIPSKDEHVSYRELKDQRDKYKAKLQKMRVTPRNDIICCALVKYVKEHFGLSPRKITVSIETSGNTEYLKFGNSGDVYTMLYRPVGIKRWRLAASSVSDFFKTSSCRCTLCELARRPRYGHEKTAAHVKKMKKALEDICAYANLSVRVHFSYVGGDKPSENLLKFQQVCKQYENR
jgi:hypothetical protein